MNQNIHIDFSATLDPLIRSKVAGHLNDCFVTQEEQLYKALSLIGIAGIEELLRVISEFLMGKMNLAQLTLNQIQQLDLRKLAYEFVKETEISIPVNLNPQEKEQYRDVLFKLGRLYLHEILFPQLVEIDPRLAFSVKNMLLRSVKMICISEDYDYKEIVRSIRLNEIEIPFNRPLALTGKSGIRYKSIRAEFMVLKLIQDWEIQKLAQVLFLEYGAICKKSAFINLVNSHGEDIESMEVPERKLKLVVHLFYRMRNPYFKNHKPLIGMNKGKGLWNFLQQNITVNGNFPERELKKLSSIINNSLDYSEIKKQVQDILGPIYQSQNKK